MLIGSSYLVSDRINRGRLARCDVAIDNNGLKSLKRVETVGPYRNRQKIPVHAREVRLLNKSALLLNTELCQKNVRVTDQNWHIARNFASHGRFVLEPWPWPRIQRGGNDDRDRTDRGCFSA
jgi:hypothetical protein